MPAVSLKSFPSGPIASLFGIAAVSLPFIRKARPVQKLMGDNNPWVVIAGIDLALFVNMMNMISSRGRITLGTILFSIGVIVGIGLVVSEILRRKGKRS